MKMVCSADESNINILGIRSPWLRWTLLFIVFAMAVVSLGHVVYKSYLNNAFDNTSWGLDLTQWWNGGRLLLQGKNPYSTVVPSAAPILLLLTPLALLPWVPATLAWAVANLILAAVCVWLMFRLCDAEVRPVSGLLLFFLFLSLIATRQVIEVGQSSLLITACTIGAMVWLAKRPWLSGILLGLAISKYTMSFPVLLYCLLARRYKNVLGCLLTQIIALLAVSLISQTSPIVIVQDYLHHSTMILNQTQDYSIHLLSLGWGYAGYVAVFVFSLAIALVLFLWYRSLADKDKSFKNELVGVTLVGILSMWSMYSVYHGRQDMVLAFLFVMVIAFRTGQGSNGDAKQRYVLTSKESMALNGFTWMVLLVWILPWYSLLGVPIYRSLYALINVAVSFVWLWLLPRVERDM